MAIRPNIGGGGGAGGGGEAEIPSQYRFEVGAEGELQIIDTATSEIVAAFDNDGSFFRESVSTGVGSYHLGGSGSGGIAHSMSSAGQNVGFKNEFTTDVDSDRVFWFPLWQGTTTDGESIVESTSLALARLDDIELGGAEGSSNVPYDFQETLTADFVVYSVTVKSSESYAGKIYNEIYSVNTGTEIYSTAVDIDTASGDLLTIPYKYPFFARSGDVLRCVLRKEDGTILQVVDNVSGTPWRQFSSRLFEDQDVFRIKTLSSNHNMIAGGRYAADTSGGGFTITVDSRDTKRTFGIFDAAETFSPTNPCTVSFDEGQGDAVLRTKNDSFVFYYDANAAAGSRWRYLDLNTKSGGIV